MQTILLQTSSYIPNPAKALATLPRLLLAGLLLTGSSAATLADCTPPPDGFVGWWRGDGSPADAAGTADGALTGNVRYGAGAVRQGFVLDGSGDAVTIGMQPALQLQNFTIESWVKRASATRATWDSLYTMGCILDCSTGGYGFALENDGRLLLTKIEYSGIWSTSLRLTNTTSFHHVAVTKSGSNVVFYVDGVGEAGPAYDPGFVFNGPLAIGARGGDLAASFLGTLDEVSIYNRALAQGEVSAIFAAGSTGKCFTGIAPVITQQPTNTSIVAGSPTSFTVLASGTRPLGFQWLRNGTTAIPGETNSILTFTQAQSADAGGYSVIVTNSYGAVTSSVATLTVLPLPPCVTPPAGLVGWWRGNASAVDAVGTTNGVLAGNASYGAGAVGQGFVLDGLGDAVTVGMHPALQLQNFTIETWVKRASATRATGGGIYSLGCLFNCSTGGYGFALEDDGRLLLTKIEYSGIWSTSLRLTNTTSFHHVAVTKSGSNVVFYVDGVAEVGPAYDPGFVFSGPLAIGARGGDLAAGFLGTLDEVSVYNRALSPGEVSALFGSGGAGKCPAGTAPAITQQPTNTSVAAGAGAEFSVTASGSSPLSFQWLRNSTDVITGRTNSTLTLPAVQLSDAGGYSVVVTNTFGAVTSQVATLTVLPPPPACANPPAGLVSWWQGESSAQDVVNRNNGTVIGNVSYGPGVVRTALVIDGIHRDRVDLGNPTSLQLQDLTIESWVKRSSTTDISLDDLGADGAVAGEGGMILSYGRYGYGLGMLNDGRLAFGRIDGSGVLSAGIVDTNWHHVAVAKTGSNVVFYVDGVGTTPIPCLTTFEFTSSVALGSRGDGRGSTFFGMMDEPAVYSRGLMATEVQAIYTAGSAGKCMPSNPPQIVTQPQSQAVAVGTDVALSVGATGTIPLSYQWWFQSSPVSEATSSSLPLPNVQLAMAGDYWVVVTNGFGATTSAVATLTVSNPPPPCASPAEGLVGWWKAEGSAVTMVGTNHGTLHGQTTYGAGMVGQCFVFDGNGDGVQVGNTASYQYQDFTLEAWIKRSSTSLVNASAGHDACLISRGGEGYSLGISSGGLPYLSKVDVSAVYSPVVVTNLAWHHLAVTKSGSVVTFYVDGVASAPVNYVVTFGYANGVAIGARGDNMGSSFLGAMDEPSIYSRPLTAAEIQSIYSAGANGKCYTVTAPQITAQPADQSVVGGEAATFTVSASGTAPLSYQWTFGGTNLAGATGTQLALSAVTAAQAGNYAVIVANVSGSVTSRTAVLTVVPVPLCVPPPAGLVGWWRGEGYPNDAVGNNLGSLKGQAGYAAGRVGQAFSFDGTGDAVSLGNPASLQLQDFTIETWTKRDSTSLTTLGWQGTACLFAYGYGGYGFGIRNSGTLLLSTVGTEIVETTNAVTDLNWHHLAVTKAGSNVVFYIDGAANPAPAYPGSFYFSSEVAIGNRGDEIGTSWDCSFLGRMDEVSIYNRALAGTEIQSIYHAGANGKCYTATAPQITGQPADQSVVLGDSASFTVLASGTPPLSYQWTFGETNLAGATGAQLLLPSVSAAKAGNYAVIVANTSGSVTSRTAVLTLHPTPPCTPPPAGLLGWWRAEGNTWNAAGASQGTLQGQTTYGSGRVGQCFVLDGSGDGVMIGSAADYQLQNFTIEAWVKRASATQVSANASGDGMIISRGGTGYGFGIGPSGSPFLTKVDVSNVTGPVLLTNTLWHHLAVTKSNTTVTFYLDGVAAASMNYVVTFAFPNGIAIGARGDNLVSCFLGSIDEPSLYERPLTAGEVQAIFAAGRSGKCFTGTPPQITTQPADQTVVAGDLASFSVTASGSGPLSYQWTSEGTNLAGATGTQLQLPSVSATQAGHYAVVVTNAFGSITSTAAVLTVLAPPPCSPPAPGLAGWWRAAGNTRETVTGVGGILAGQAGYAPGKVGTAFVFDGTTDGVHVMGQSAGLQLQNFTIEAWVKRSSAAQVTGNAAQDALFISYGGGGYGLGMNPSGQPFLTKVGTSAALAPALITNTAWHHVAVTKSGPLVSFQVDGVPYPTTAIYVNGSSYPVTNFPSVFTFATDIAIGAKGVDLANSFLGSVDEASIYARPLTTNEILAIYAAGNGGKCVVPAAPFITASPTTQSVVQGGNVTFSVAAVGAAPLSYQWARGGTTLPGATNTSLALTNVQFSQAGSYAVIVTNAGGSVTSSNAWLTVAFPPATVRIVSTNGMSGAPVVVPITILANGNENALGASLSYDPAQLTFVSAVPGPGAPDATLFVNTNLLPSGRIGFTIALPTDIALAAGSQNVVLASFTSPVRSTAISPSIGFTDTPTGRQLVDVYGTPLNATYTAGSVALSASVLESDAAPRPDGDHELLVADWVLLGRYVARLDYPTNASEFQRADSAPRAAFGDGAIKVTDWVQAGRYVAGLDPLTVIGGPDVELPLAPPGHPPKDPTTRRVLVVPNQLIQGTTGMVAIALDSLGNENAVAASLSFDPTRLTYVSSTKGSASSIATLNVNAAQAAAGKLGFALALPTGYAYPAGSRELVRVTFRAVGQAGTTNVSFADSPVPRDVSDPAAISLACDYAGADVPIRSAPVLGIQRAGNQVVLTWPGWATNFTLKATGGIPSGAWTNTAASPALVNGELRVSLPVPERTLFYRLSQP